eukprot:258494-Pleurochrysis_carterae.AAC.1
MSGLSDCTGVRTQLWAPASYGSGVFVTGGGCRCGELCFPDCVFCRDVFTLHVVVCVAGSASANTNSVDSIRVEAAVTEQEK